MSLRELAKAEKEAYLQGFMKAKLENLAERLEVTEEEVIEILLKVLSERNFYTKFW